MLCAASTRKALSTANRSSVIAQEQNVNPDSQTETFVALRLFIDNWRWADVPVYMRVGKRLPKSATEISVHFKKAPAVLFNKESAGSIKTCSSFGFSPTKESRCECRPKCRAPVFASSRLKWIFIMELPSAKPSPEAYERLLLDAMSGDATLFARATRSKQAWAFIDPIEEAWHAKKDAPELYFYPAGSWGPEAADDLLARDGRAWRRL